MALRKKQKAELKIAVIKMLRFTLVEMNMDRIRNEYFRGTVPVICFGEKAREARLRWFGPV